MCHGLQKTAFCVFLFAATGVPFGLAQGEKPLGLYEEDVFRTLELTFFVDDWHEQLVENWHINDETGEVIYLKADLLVDDVVYHDVGVEYKGQSTFHVTQGLKKPYKITMDAFVEDQELYGFDKVTLNNGGRDFTLMRELIAYKILRQYMPAPRANMVKLRSGTELEKQDIGVYISVERVNKRFFDKHFISDEGHRYKALNGRMAWFGDDPEAYHARYAISGGDPDTAYLDLIEAIDRLNNGALGDASHLNQVFSVDRAVRLMASGPALLNRDDLRSGRNYFLFQDLAYGQLITLPWDWDNSFGGPPDQDFYLTFDNPDVPLVHRLMGLPSLQARYRAFVNMLAQDLEWEKIGPWVTLFRSLAEEDIVNGQHELFSPEQYFQAQVELEALIRGRGDFLRNHDDIKVSYPVISDLQHRPIKPTDADSIQIRATLSPTVEVAEVLLHVQFDGAFKPVEMFDDGNHGDGEPGDGVYGVVLNPYPAGHRVNYYLEATATEDGAKSFDPRTTEFKPRFFDVIHVPLDSQLFINEFMAKNDNGIVDENGSHEDWAELYNGGDEDLDLQGYFLTDDLADSTKWAFPPVVIPAGGHLLIWCDDDEEDGPLHASFKLSTSGESIGLFTPLEAGNGLLDSYTFDQQTADVSEGRIRDGGEPWTFFQQPTPLAPNQRIAADFDGDGKIGLLDLVSLINAQGNCLDPCPPLCKGDVNGDCIVDKTDLVSVTDQWNSGSP